MKKLCIECSQAIIGRADKKFCDDHCRSNYNNRLKAKSMTFVRTVNQILMRNRKVLAVLNKEGKTKVAKTRMIREGFNFEYFTHVLETQKGSVYRFCYEEGYIFLGGDWCLLVRNKEVR